MMQSHLGFSRRVSPNEFGDGSSDCLSHPMNCLPGGRQGWLMFGDEIMDNSGFNIMVKTLTTEFIRWIRTKSLTIPDLSR